MASAGNGINNEYTIGLSERDVYQRLSMAIGMGRGGYFDGYTVITDGVSRFDITRKYMATWTIVLAIILGLCTLIGFLFFLYRKTENCTVMCIQNQGCTRVQVAGTLSPELYNQLNMTLSSMQR